MLVIRAAQTARDLTIEVKAFFVYMMTNRSRVVLDTGVTNDLERRVWEHKNGTVRGFTKQYKRDRLVYYEEYRDIRDAITRGKRDQALAPRKEKCIGADA